MSIQEKFDKAVNVIKHLPKDGAYQPSHELQLRFYGYYKQATEGINYHPKPSFWEVVKRAKWDAWAKLGNMTKEEAMIHYVEELRKIVETMSYNDNVANFLNSLDNFYEHVPAEDLELLVGPVIEKMRSRPNSPLSGSPLASRDTSPSRSTVLSQESSSHFRLDPNSIVHNTTKHSINSLETSPASSYSASPLPPDTEDEEEEEHFLDTVTEPEKGRDGNLRKNQDQVKEMNHISSTSHDDSNLSGISSASTVHNVRLDPMNGIKEKLDLVNNRLLLLENLVSHQTSHAATTFKSESCNGSCPSDQDGKILPGSSPAAFDVFRRAIENMNTEMDNLQKRMTTLEIQRQQEVSWGRKRSGAVVPRWWGLPLKTTTILLAWPILILLISNWLSRRRKR